MTSKFGDAMKRTYVRPEDEICIKQYSVDACAMLVMQVLTWMWVGSWTKNPKMHRDESMWYRWYGFVLFMPMWIYGFWCMFNIYLVNSRRTTEIQQQELARKAGQKIDHQDGIPANLEEYHLEYVHNTSLSWKYTWFWWGLWGPMIKLSFDDYDNYSWAFALSVWLFYTCYLLMVAWRAGNYFGIDQREINIMMSEIRRKEEADMKKNNPNIDDNDDDDDTIVMSVPTTSTTPILSQNRNDSDHVGNNNNNNNK